ncbi:DciA family protein [[Kitasatospora] papulosa]|uniref:DciA family protein n=1 Tax=[Kitasatospora] papulosa TaxID=1464011 RepID=UPI003625BB6C
MTDKTASGKDLARQALAAYKATAKTTPASKPKLRTVKRDRGPGRDPVGLGGILGNISTEQGWDLAREGGSIRDQWATLCPELVGHAEPVAYDAEQRRLDVRPASPAYATHLRVSCHMLRGRINSKLGKDVVRTINVLPVGAVAGEPSSATAPAVKAAPGPVKTRETACAGYRAALAAVVRPEPRTADARVLEAIARQDQDAPRESEAAFAATVAAMQDLAPTAVRESERARLAAVEHKYGAADSRLPRTAFGAA